MFCHLKRELTLFNVLILLCQHYSVMSVTLSSFPPQKKEITLFLGKLSKVLLIGDTEERDKISTLCIVILNKLFYDWILQIKNCPGLLTSLYFQYHIF